jgi:hypothetical protein
MGDTIEAETAEASGRTFITGNTPEYSPFRRLGCRYWVNPGKELRPNVLDVVGKIAKVVRPP